MCTDVDQEKNVHRCRSRGDGGGGGGGIGDIRRWHLFITKNRMKCGEPQAC